MMKLLLSICTLQRERIEKILQPTIMEQTTHVDRLGGKEDRAHVRHYHGEGRVRPKRVFLNRIAHSSREIYK